MKHQGLSGFIGNISELMASTILIQIISVVSLPIITRLYRPEIYGHAAYIWAIVTVVSITACLKFEAAIVLECDKKRSDSLVWMCIFIALVTCLLGFLVAAIAHYGLSRYLPYQLQSYHIFFIPLAVAFYGLQKVYEFKNARDKTFRKIGSILLLGAVLATVYKWLMGFWRPDVTNFLIGNIIQLSTLAFFLFLEVDKRSSWRGTVGYWRDNLRRHGALMRTLLPSELFNVMTSSLPLLVVGSYLGSTAVGLYSVAWMIILRPISVLGEAISSVYLGRANEMLEQGLLYTDLRMVVVMIVLVCTFPVLLLAYIAEPLMAWLLGQEWLKVGTLITVMAPLMLSILVNKPCVQSMIVMGKLKFLFKYNVVGFIFRLGTLVLSLVVFQDLVKAALCFSIAGTLANVFIVLSAIYFSKQHDKYKLLKTNDH